MLELATLGLLLQQPLHGYRLKQQMELFMRGCISVNYGAIYPLLKRLEEKQWIEVFTENEDHNNPRKIYQITEQGREKWKAKMLEHPQESWVNARSRFMIKYFFFSYLEVPERINLLQHRLMICKLQLEKCQNEESIFDGNDPYQLEASQRYKLTIVDEIDWLQKQLVGKTGEQVE